MFRELAKRPGAPPGMRREYVNLISQAGREQFSGCLATGRDSVVVAGPDGRIRRFPRDTGTNLFALKGYENGLPLVLGRTLVKQSKFIYDAHQGAVIKPLAGYVYDAQARTLTFQVQGKPTESIHPKFDVFPLADGKWMVPQPELRDCSYACSEMLLAEGKPASEVLAQLRHFKETGSRANVKETTDSLGWRTEREVVLVEGAHDAGTSAQRLQQIVQENGPCMLALSGHWRMLDAVDLTARGAVFTIRDPFSGTSLKVADHEQFWEMDGGRVDSGKTALGPTDATTVRHWEAIYLKPPKAAEGLQPSSAVDAP